ncbi:MAG: nitroreductase family protein [Gammaproteobacteria bacterium]|jgi:nitroreductase
MFEKRATTQVPINDVLDRRWSGRAFDPDRKPSRRQLVALLEAARWAPSCFGDEPWRYIVCARETNPEAWQNALACLSEGNQAWAGSAPVLMLAVSSLAFSGNGKPNRWAQYDTGAASMSLVTQATDLGLMAHQMGGFDAGRAKQMFSIPQDHEPMAMIAVGYQLPREAIPEALLERELAPRRRRPLGENFFDGIWGEPVRN